MNRINRGLIVPHLSKPSQTIMTFDTQTDIFSAQKIGMSEMPLTVEQEQAAQLVYGDARAAAELILKNESMTDYMKVTKLLSELMKILERARPNGAKLSGSNKKAVALVLLRRLINELIQESSLITSLISTVESVGEHLLETLADIGRSLNLTEVQQQAAEAVCDGCCAVLQALLKK